MITDCQTDIVYFSKLLKAKKSFTEIELILIKHHINYEILEETKDIWARDYMPIQTDINRFVQFRYEPSYLAKDLHLQSNPKVVCNSNSFTLVYSDINLDGGNLVKWNNKVMLTDRLFSENPQYKERKHLISEIERILNAETIIIPQIKSDFTGHADGLVRFYDDKTIIGNSLNDEYKYWGNAMKNIIQQYGFEYIDMPVFEYKAKYKNKRMSAIGCYMNYLEIGDLIVFPVFECEGNKDDEAFGLLSSFTSVH